MIASIDLCCSQPWPEKFLYAVGSGLYRDSKLVKVASINDPEWLAVDGWSMIQGSGRFREECSERMKGADGEESCECEHLVVM